MAYSNNSLPPFTQPFRPNPLPEGDHRIRRSLFLHNWRLASSGSLEHYSLMRLRLFHQLFLLIAGTALLAALAMAIVLSLNLRSGFSDYLNARDAEMLSRFVENAAQNMRMRGDAAAVRNGRISIPAVLDDMVAKREIPGAPPGFSFKRPPSLLGDGPTAAQKERARERRGPPPPSFATRLLVLDPEDNRIVGPAPPSGLKLLEVPIQIDGETVAKAQLLPRGRTPENDAQFLQSQYRGAAIITALLLALAALPAFWFARMGARRLAAMQKAANEIAQGDLTARVAVTGRDELSAMGRDINSMAESLSQLDSSRRRWLAEISHELRTPLSVLVGELDALRDGIRPLTMGAVQSLSDEAQRLGRIVNDLHFLAMADLSGTSCQVMRTDAVSILNRMQTRFEQAFVDAKIVLGIDCGGLSNLPVIWDQPRIGQVLANLLTNSLRYTNAPGRARISLAATERDVSIQIDDSAPSVDDKHLDRLFDPLYRVDESRSRASGGSGLGLAVSDAIVKSHGGRMTASRSDLGGLSITIILPRDASKI
jgi:two-component system, OmpR family, sensor histidine kinase BaeS